MTSDLKQSADEVTKDLKAGAEGVSEEPSPETTEIKQVNRPSRAAHEWTGPKPVSGPTPEDAMADLEEIERGNEEDGEA